MEQIVDALKVNGHFVPNGHSFRRLSWQAATAYKHKCLLVLCLSAAQTSKQISMYLHNGRCVISKLLKEEIYT